MKVITQLMSLYLLMKCVSGTSYLSTHQFFHIHTASFVKSRKNLSPFFV